MPKLLSLLLLLLPHCQHLVAQSLAPEAVLSTYVHTVGALAHDSLHGRPAGGAEEKLAIQIISQQLQPYPGAQILFQSFSFLAPDSAGKRKAQNILCFVDQQADSTIVIGAHYDHIGMGGKRSNSIGKRAVHNGADDNASGVALLLGLAQRFEEWKQPGYNYLFVAYSAHEVGLFGSEALAKKWKGKFKAPCLVLNFDMVGRMQPADPWFKVMGMERDSCMQAFFKENAQVGIHLGEDALLAQLDTRSFLAQGIRCLSLSTGSHTDYHKVSDDVAKINFEGIWQVQLGVEALLKQWPVCR